MVRRAAIAVSAAAVLAVAAGALHGGSSGGASAAVTPTWDDVAPVFAAKTWQATNKEGLRRSRSRMS